MRRWLFPFSLTTASVLFLSIAVPGWRSSVLRNRQRVDQERTARLIKNGRADEAAAIAGAFAEKTNDSEQRSQWQNTEVAALTESGDAARLVTIYRNRPSTILKNEEASLLTARALRFTCQNEKAAITVIAAWQKKTHHPEWWLCLEADSLLAKNQRDAAIQLLKNHHFTGTADTGRLLRLALLCNSNTPTGMRTAWGYVQAAYRIAPNDPDVRSYRAQILERFGRYSEARVEYVAARLAKPQSSYHCDQLAEYYQRQGSTAMAIQTWLQGIATCPADFLAIKALFWSRMVVPSNVAAPESKATLKNLTTQLPTENLLPLVTYLSNLPAGTFWDDTAFNALPNGPQLAKSRREIFYLRLCNALQKNQEEAAWQLIKGALQNPDIIQTNPALIRSLMQLLAFRKDGDFSSLTGKKLPDVIGEQYPFLVQLDAAASGHRPLDPATKRFLCSKEAFAALFLTTGWWEASLHLRPNGEAVPTTAAPSWYVYALTQALRANRDDQTALLFAQKSDSRLPAERVLIGEMLVAAGRIDEGATLLSQFATADNDAGTRAAWLLAVADLEEGKLSEAERRIHEQPRLARDVIGKELLARIALARGDRNNAEQLYRAISADSLEAQAYLAHDAFAHKDWQKAQAMTLQIQQEIPDDMTIRENLQIIAAEIAKQAQAKK